MFMSSHYSQQPSFIEQLKARLILVVGLLIGCLVLISGVGIYTMLSQQGLGDQKVAMTSDVNFLLQAMVDEETGIRGYISTQNTTFLDPYTSGQANYHTVFQQLQTTTSGTTFQSAALALRGANERATAWSMNYAQPEIARLQAGNQSAAQSDQVNLQGKRLFDAFRSAIVDLQQATDEDLAALQTQMNSINFAALGGVGFLSILAILLLWHTFTRFAALQRDRLAVLQETATVFGSGDLSARVPYLADADLHSVGETFNTMASTLQEQHNALVERDILELISQLNAILTGSLDRSALVDNFLQSCLSLLDVQIGVLYMYDSHQNQLYLFAARGVLNEQIPQAFALGEGLIGQTAQERVPLMVTAAQQEMQSFQIKTILGKALPASMYHLPLVRGDELLGVLAVGSVYPMREQARHVLSVITSNVASALSNAQAYVLIQEQAKELRERTRQQEETNLSLRQQRDELTTLNAALVEANQARSRFLATMSHELRTPLTSTIGFAQLLLRTSERALLSERQINNVERILKNAHHLLSLINTVLDLAKIEAGRMDVHATTVDLKELLTSLVEETHSIAVQRGIMVSVEVSNEVARLETDPLKLRQIVLNLLSNALKFTEQGTITLTATSRTVTRTDEWETTNAHQVAIAVKDSGIGIAPEQQAHIFDAFYQVDNSNSRKYGGTGLGLSIVRELTTLLGGKVEIESQSGQGTTFTVLLPQQARDRYSLQDIRLNTLHQPLTAAEGAIFEREQPNDSASFLVVAIDDNPDVLQIISSSLEQSPYRVVGVQDATQAVTIIQQLQPHVVTLDIMMPQVNGWQILNQLRSDPATANIPIILLTVLEDRSAGYVLGANEYLVKPVARETLLATLQQLTRVQPGAVHTATLSKLASQVPIQKRDGQSESGQVLTSPFKQLILVQHEMNVHELVEQLVTRKGYHLSQAAFERELIARIEQASPDLLILFVQLQEYERSKQASMIIVKDDASSHTSP